MPGMVVSCGNPDSLQGQMSREKIAEEECYF